MSVFFVPKRTGRVFFRKYHPTYSVNDYRYIDNQIRPSRCLKNAGLLMRQYDLFLNGHSVFRCKIWTDLLRIHLSEMFKYFKRSPQTENVLCIYLYIRAFFFIIHRVMCIETTVSLLESLWYVKEQLYVSYIHLHVFNIKKNGLYIYINSKRNLKANDQVAVKIFQIFLSPNNKALVYPLIMGCRKECSLGRV